MAGPGHRRWTNIVGLIHSFARSTLSSPVQADQLESSRSIVLAGRRQLMIFNDRISL